MTKLRILLKIPKAPNKNINYVKDYQDALENFDYQEKELIFLTHTSLKDWDDTDIYFLNEVMSARSPKDRPKSLWDIAGGIPDKKERR